MKKAKKKKHAHTYQLDIQYKIAESDAGFKIWQQHEYHSSINSVSFIIIHKCMQ